MSEREFIVDQENVIKAVKKWITPNYLSQIYIKIEAISEILRSSTRRNSLGEVFGEGQNISDAIFPLKSSDFCYFSYFMRFQGISDAELVEGTQWPSIEYKTSRSTTFETHEERESVQSPHIMETDVADSEAPALKFRSKATRVIQRRLKFELIIDFLHAICWYSTQSPKRIALNLMNFSTNLNLYQFSCLTAHYNANYTFQACQMISRIVQFITGNQTKKWA